MQPNADHSQDKNQQPVTPKGSPTEGVSYPVPKLADDAHPIAKVVENYILAIRNIAQTVSIVMPHLAKWEVEEIKKHRRKISHLIPEDVEEGQEAQIRFDSARDFVELTATMRTLEELHTSKAIPVLARSLFMQMFSEFDAFMGSLLKVIYLKNQDLLRGIAREITLKDLFEYKSIDEVKRSMLEKEIETFRRDSYVEQFASLEKKFQIPLRKFEEYPEFIELSQRRNIFTHNDGVVSDQYIIVCEREGWRFPQRPIAGDTLHVDMEYFGRALCVMSKVGFMLAHTLWSKIFPQESDAIHDSIDSRIYQCLQHKRWRLAAELGTFALSDPMRKGVKELDLRIRTINAAIGLKFGGRDDEARRLLGATDWSASYRDFKLAILILEEKYEDAIKIMLSIGKSGEILEQSSYYSWPLFHKFRERPEFYSTYEQIYGEPYSTQVPTDGKSASVTVSETSREKPGTGTDQTGVESAPVAEGPRSPPRKAASPKPQSRRKNQTRAA